MASTRIGVFGGSFDPVHIGHLVAAAGARHACRLDTVLLMVANEPWQKSGERAVSPAELRYEMVRAAVEGHEGFEASRLEIDRGGPSYTVDTLCQLSEINRDSELFLIVGADTAQNMETWKEWQQVAKLATLVVLNRPGSSIGELDAAWRVERATIPAVDVSSTELRDRLAHGISVDFLIPDAALKLLQASGLYSGLQESGQFSD